MFGEEAQDWALTLARGSRPEGHSGLWPEFAMLNHSCAPNAANLTVEDRMLVRAAADVAQVGRLRRAISI